MTQKVWVYSKQHTGQCALCETSYEDLAEFQTNPANAEQISSICRTCSPVSDDQIAAQQELFRRELLRRRLINFIINFVPNYNAGWVHKLICAKLERFVRDVEDKKSPRAMFFQPPRTGKSTIVSKAFPAWALGHHPDWEFISASYASSLPEGFSRWIKSVLASPEYQVLFPKTKLDPNAQATSGWYTTQQGMYLPVGVGGGATGKGAHIFNIDDPVKDATEADSETTLQNVWNWWDSVADTRISPGGGVLVTLTRWSDLDLAGRLIAQEREALKELHENEGEMRQTLDDPTSTSSQRDVARRRIRAIVDERQYVIRWDVLSFPAMSEQEEYLTTDGRIVHDAKDSETGLVDPTLRKVRGKDEALHPARYDEDFYRRKRKSTQPRFWNAMFQQKPVPDEGSIFKRKDFRLEPHVAPWYRWHVYSAWDFAIGQKQQNDWTSGVVAALDFGGKIHLLDVIRVRTDEPAKLLVDTLRPYQDNLQMVGIETGQIQQAVMPDLTKRINDKEKGYPMVFCDDLHPIIDKIARARPAQGWSQQGKILLPADQPWLEDFIGELLRFPNGVWDDQVDALAWLIRMVAKQSAPQRPKETKKKSWKDNLKKVHLSGGRGSHMAA